MTPSKADADDAAKAAARRDRNMPAQQPGAVASSEAARLDSLIAERNLHPAAAASVRPGASQQSSYDDKVAAKIRSAGVNSQDKTDSHTVSSTADVAHERLTSLEDDLVAKQKGRSAAVAAGPGAFSVASAPASKGATGPRNVTSETNSSSLESLDDRVAAKMRGNMPSSRAENQLDRVEAAIEAKMRTGGVATAPGAVAASSKDGPSSQMSSKMSAKLSSNSSNQQQQPGANGLAELENQILAKEQASYSKNNNKSPDQGLTPYESKEKAFSGAVDVPSTSSQANDKDSTLTKKKGAEAEQHGDNDQFETKTLMATSTAATVQSGQGAGLAAKSPLDMENGDDMLLRKNNENNELGVSPEHHEKNQDLEYGVYGGPDEQGLAVAFAVEEDADDAFIPAAVEYDPDAKPAIQGNRRVRFYAAVAMAVVVIASIGIVMGLVLSSNSSPQELPFRSVLGIREHVELLVGSEVLEDFNSPYRKALDWIQDADPMALTPESKKFIQRYLAAYFYFSTSMQKPWTGGCEAGQPDNCVFEGISERTKFTIVRSGNRWLSSVDECLWHGILCDESGQIYSIEVESSSLTGSIPEGIVHFRFLRSLKLNHNELNGQLPPALADMQHLHQVQLINNKLTGSIPDTWYSSRMQFINVGTNELRGTVPEEVAALKDLRTFFLYENDFSGTIPSVLSQLGSLYYLHLSNNAFVGTIPTSLGNLHQVIELFLGQNELTGTLPTELGRNLKIKKLSVSNNLLNGTIPTELSNLDSLWELYLQDNYFTGTLYSGFGNWGEGFTDFRVENNNLNGVIPSELGKLTTMVNFFASGNNFTGSIAEEICKLRAPEDEAGAKGALDALRMDCGKAPETGIVEIVCKPGCCTICCQADGANCVNV